MAQHTAIAEAGEVLVGLLRDQLGSHTTDAEVVLRSPVNVTDEDEVRLTLFLYRVAENGELLNQPRRPVGTTADEVRPPPLALDLYYLLTAHPSAGSNELVDRTRAQHLILGRAMQILRDNAVLRASELAGTSLAEDRELHLSVYPQPLEDVTGIWNTFSDKPYEPSVAYVVGPVLIDSQEVSPATRTETYERQYRSYGLAPDDAADSEDEVAPGPGGGGGGL